MNQRMRSHFFWGAKSPLSALTGCSLLVMASSRLSFAVFCAGAVFWVYVMSALVYFFSKELMPEKGRMIILTFLSGLFGSIYLLVTGLINPLIVMGCWFFAILIPPCLLSSGVLTDLEDADPSDALIRVGLEALSLGLLVITISLIREPLGFGSLSLPGGRGGIFEIFRAPEESFSPVRLISVSGGGLLILGYITALYRYLQDLNRTEDDL